MAQFWKKKLIEGCTDKLRDWLLNWGQRDVSAQSRTTSPALSRRSCAHLDVQWPRTFQGHEPVSTTVASTPTERIISRLCGVRLAISVQMVSVSAMMLVEPKWRADACGISPKTGHMCLSCLAVFSARNHRWTNNFSAAQVL